MWSPFYKMGMAAGAAGCSLPSAVSGHEVTVRVPQTKVSTARSSQVPAEWQWLLCACAAQNVWDGPVDKLLIQQLGEVYFTQLCSIQSLYSSLHILERLVSHRRGAAASSGSHRPPRRLPARCSCRAAPCAVRALPPACHAGSVGACGGFSSVHGSADSDAAALQEAPLVQQLHSENKLLLGCFAQYTQLVAHTKSAGLPWRGSTEATGLCCP